MDLIKQNKVIGWVIVILVGLNLLTLSIIWLRSDNPALEPEFKPGGQMLTVRLLQREIGLTKEQADKYEEMRQQLRSDIESINAQLGNLKLSIANEIFEGKADEEKVKLAADKIGLLQSQIELLRFRHFRNLAGIMTGEQRVKFRPILEEVFGRANPNEKIRGIEPPAARGEKSIPPAARNMPRPPGFDFNPENRLARLTERLSLTHEQAAKLKRILSDYRVQGEKIGNNSKPATADMQKLRENKRKEEDEKIKQILNEDQRKIYERIIIERDNR